ncbi:MAG: hypothetical protein JXA52_01370 [Planctomycetes bacterium]|nr:hypothetical protein [Planctomycetota bacterium]
MRNLTILLLLMLFFSSASASERLRIRRYNPRQRVDLDLNGKNLGEVLAELKEKSGVDFIVEQDVARPEEFPQQVLYFDLRGLTLQQSLDWITRALGTRYRVGEDGKTIVFSSSYGWLDEITPIYNAIPLGMITTWEEREDFCLQVKELMKLYAVREPQYQIRLREADYRLEVNLPEELQSRLNASFRAMLNPGKIPQPRNPEAAIDLQGLEQTLAKKVLLDSVNTPLNEILAELSFQADINIGFDHLPFWNRRIPALTLPRGETTLAEALAVICTRTKLGGWLLSPSQGLWLTVQEVDEDRSFRYYSGRELLWEDVPVRGYAVPMLARRLGEEKLLEKVRGMLPLDVATDPSVGAIYHARGGNLILIAPEGVQEIVEDGLARLDFEQ